MKNEDKNMNVRFSPIEVNLGSFEWDWNISALKEIMSPEEYENKLNELEKSFGAESREELLEGAHLRFFTESASLFWEYPRDPKTWLTHDKIDWHIVWEGELLRYYKEREKNQGHEPKITKVEFPIIPKEEVIE